MEKSIQSKDRLRLFLILTFATCWGLAAAYYFLFPEPNEIVFASLAMLYMFVPAIVTLVIDKAIDKRKGIASLGIRFSVNRWYLVAWLIMPIIVFAGFGLNLLWPGIEFSPDMSGFFESIGADKAELMRKQMQSLPISPLVVIILQALFAGLTVNALFGLGEELGWRGFMLRAYRNLSFWQAALRIGIIWGIWHAPLILMGHNYPQHSQIGVGMMVLMCVLLSPVFLYVRLKSGSVIAAAILHGTLNASAAIPIMYLGGGNDLTLGLTGFMGFLAVFIFILILIVFDKVFSKKPILNATLLEADSNLEA